MKKFRFLDEGFAGDVFYSPSVDGQRPVAIFLFGFPSFPGPTAVTDVIVESGYVAVVPHYIGTYDSDGILSPQTLVETVSRIGDLVGRGYLTQAKDGRPFALDNHVTACIGHSFGCAAALRGAQYLNNLKTLVLLAPTAHYSRTTPDFGVLEDGPDQVRYVRSSHPHTYRLADDAAWEELMTGRDPLPEPPINTGVDTVVGVIGDSDRYFSLREAAANLPQLFAAYCGDTAQISMRILPGRSHPAPELIDCAGIFSLQEHLEMTAVATPA